MVYLIWLGGLVSSNMKDFIAVAVVTVLTLILIWKNTRK